MSDAPNVDLAAISGQNGPNGAASVSWEAPFDAPSGLFRQFLYPTGSLLSMVESHVLMVAEVFHHDQTLPRKSGSRPT
jgi:hypothetical protein